MSSDRPEALPPSIRRGYGSKRKKCSAAGGPPGADDETRMPSRYGELFDVKTGQVLRFPIHSVPSRRTSRGGAERLRAGPHAAMESRTSGEASRDVSHSAAPARTPAIEGVEGGFMELGGRTGSLVGYWRDVFDSPEEMMKALEGEVEWLEKDVVVRGHKRKQPRLIAYMADAEDLTYTYSGLKLWPKEYAPTVRRIKEVLESRGGLDFNCVLVNFYRHGDDNVGWHADDEALFGKDPTIGSVSFGVRRDFILRSNDDVNLKYIYRLGQGDVLVMKGTTQEKFKHCIPKRRRVMEGRINLTFRKIVHKERLRKGEVAQTWENVPVQLQEAVKDEIGKG